MKLIRNIGEGAMLVLVLGAIAVVCLFNKGSWNPGGDDL